MMKIKKMVDVTMSQLITRAPLLWRVRFQLLWLWLGCGKEHTGCNEEYECWGQNVKSSTHTNDSQYTHEAHEVQYTQYKDG